MFGLAAVAAFVSLVFIGASSAMATGETALCKVNELACPAEQIYTGHVEALSTKAVLKGAVNVTCKHSAVLGEALAPAKPLVIHVTLLDFKECNCEVKVIDQTGLILALKTASNLATGTAHGFEVKVTCFGVSCTYGGVAEGAHGLGGEPATIVATEAELELLEGSKLCGEKPGLFTATYEVLLPKPIYISESSTTTGETALCKVNELACPAEQIYTGHVEALSTKAVLKGAVNVTCKHSAVLGEALAPAKPLVIHVTLLDFKECNCEVKVIDQTGLILALKTASNLATGTAHGFEVKVTCFGVSCTYGGVAEGAHGLGGEPATIVATEAELELLEGSKLCGEKPGLFTATYEVLLPKPIYISE